MSYNTVSKIEDSAIYTFTDINHAVFNVGDQVRFYSEYYRDVITGEIVRLFNRVDDNGVSEDLAIISQKDDFGYEQEVFLISISELNNFDCLPELDKKVAKDFKKIIIENPDQTYIVTNVRGKSVVPRLRDLRHGWYRFENQLLYFTTFESWFKNPQFLRVQVYLINLF